MRLTVNGKLSEVNQGSEDSEPMTVASFLADCKLLVAQGSRVAVELNGKVVPRRDFDNVVLKDGDSLEVVTLVGGG